MKILGKILGGDFMKSVSKIVDNVVTTDEERLQLKANLKKIVAEADANAQEQITRRWEADAKAGWLPANIRPLTLAFLMVSTVLLVFIDSGAINFNVAERWISLIEICIITCIILHY